MSAVDVMVWYCYCDDVIVKYLMVVILRVHVPVRLILFLLILRALNGTSTTRHTTTQTVLPLRLYRATSSM